MILLPGVFRNAHAIVHGVSRAGWNQTHIHHRARGPGIAFVDGIAVSIDLQRAVEVSAFLDRTVAVVFDHAAPENRLAFVVGALQFEPGVVGVDSAAGKKVSDFLRAHDHVDAHGVASTHGGLHTVERSGDRATRLHFRRQRLCSRLLHRPRK